MKKRILTLMLLLVASLFAAKANPVDMRTVREVAVKFVNANTKVQLRNADELQLVTTYNISRGDAAFHIFNTPNGFVIVSADDCATPILGYSEEGRFNVENIPIQLQDIFHGYVEQIQYGIENHLEADEQIAQQWELVRTIGRLTNNRTDEVVEPLLSTTWGQGSPYNMYVPNGYSTGCVATAMAQIMKYWEWPIQGIGEHSYQWNGQTLSANFGETTYDWANMLDSYDGQSTQEQNEAVATLMWHCGVSVNMSYSPTGSGSALNSQLINYFRYSNEMRGEWRSMYSDATWKAKLKDCLNLGRPLYYSGNPDVGTGHAFVCDGYANSDLFHLNWGWSGNGNGYFALDAFIASGSAAYINNHRAIFNIHPEGETTNYLINVSANNDEHGIVTGGGMFSHGSNVTLSATANSGYHFCYWEENGGIASTNPNYSFIANFNRDLVAVFADSFTITVTGTDGGTVSGGGSFLYGQSCTVNATADDGYGFANWTKNGVVVSADANYTFSVAGESLLIAHFVPLEGNIEFADDNVKAICVANWDTNGDGELSYVEAASVLSLGEVFKGNSEITSFDELQFFIGLNSISENAFMSCSGLTRLPIFSPSITSIGKYAFFGCSGMVGELTIPSSIVSIGYEAFAGCSGFTGSLTIPNSVTSIGDAAFHSCTGLTGSLIISNSVTSIGNYAFCNCYYLKGDLIIPNSVTIIGNSAFSFCYGLSGTLTIPSSVNLINERAFYGCRGLKSIIALSDMPPVLGPDAFYQVPTTIPVYVPCESSEAYQSTEGWDAFSNIVCISSGTISVVADPIEGGEVSGGGMYECGAFCTVTATPNEGYSFINWTENGSVVSYDSIYSFVVTSESVLTAHFALEENIVFADDHVKAICVANWDTNGDGELNYVEAASVLSLGEVFKGNSEITSFDELQFFIGLNSISENAFMSCSGLTRLPIFSPSITSIGKYAFFGCSGMVGELTIPNTIVSIGYGAFAACSGFTGSLTVPNSVTSIGDAAFHSCTGLTGSLIISNSVTSIGNYAFCNCYYLKGDLIIPNSVTIIGNSAFGFCNGLSGTLTIPSSVNLINERAFYGCRGLKSIIALSDMPPVLGPDAFYQVPTTIPVYVPCESSETYQSTEGWDAFSNIVCISSGTISVVADPNGGGVVSGGGMYEGGAFCAVTATPNEGYRFANWTKNGCIVSSDSNYSFVVTGDCVLTAQFVLDGNIVFADPNVKAICVTNWDTNGDGELSYLEAALVINLEEVFRGNPDIASFEELQYFIGLATIADYAFYNCSGLTGCLTIPNSVTSIGNYAFYNCSALNSSVISSYVNRIGNWAFYNCSSLNAVYYTGDINQWCNIQFSNFGSNPLVCAHNLFIDNDLVTNLVIPETIMEVRDYTFYGATCLTSLTLSDSVTTIGRSVFWGCSGLTGNLIIPNSVTSIGSSAFHGCCGLTGDLVIPNSVTSIGDYAFSGCSGFTGNLAIPNYVASINSGTFSQCTGLTSITVLAINPPTMDNYAFSGVNKSIPVYVPCSSMWAYQNAEGWNEFTNYMPGTACDSGECFLVFDLYDSFGDGWTDNYLVIDYGDGNSEQLTINSGSSASYSRMVATGSHITLTWITGDWPGECSFTVHYMDDDLICEIDHIESDFDYSFDVDCSGGNVTQTIAFSQGINWFSTYVDITLEDLKAALVAAAEPNTTIMIKNSTQSIVYSRGHWNGTLDWDVAKKYNITVASACELTLEGMPVVLTMHPITIVGGGMATWIGFPLIESMTLTNAFAGFAQDGDMVKSQYGNAIYSRGHWNGEFSLEPGKGYLYISAEDAANRTLTFPTSAK